MHGSFSLHFINFKHMRKCLFLVVLWLDMSDFNTESIITVFYKVCFHLLLQSRFGTSTIWQLHPPQPPYYTQTQNTHCHNTRIHQDIRGSSPCLTQCCLKVGVGFPCFSCEFLSEQETAPYSEQFLLTPIRTRAQGFFNIPEGMCMSQKMNLAEHYIQCSGICVTPRTGSQSHSQLWHDFQVQARQIGLKLFTFLKFCFIVVPWCQVNEGRC